MPNRPAHAIRPAHAPPGACDPRARHRGKRTFLPQRCRSRTPAPPPAVERNPRQTPRGRPSRVLREMPFAAAAKHDQPPRRPSADRRLPQRRRDAERERRCHRPAPLREVLGVLRLSANRAWHERRREELWLQRDRVRRSGAWLAGAPRREQRVREDARSAQIADDVARSCPSAARRAGPGRSHSRAARRPTRSRRGTAAGRRTCRARRRRCS